MSRKKTIQKEVEYEDAPSGYVTFYNYKEPLMKFEKGFGYVGALVFDGATDKVQCHFCGEWYHHLGPHLAKEHNMKASQYKEAVGLLQSTALISESAREKLIASGMKKRLKNLKKIKGKRSEETKRKIRETLIKNFAEKDEMLNLKGTCPAQLIDRIQKKYQEDPNNWTLKKLKAMTPAIKKIYGTVEHACNIAGVPYRKPSHTIANETKRKTEPLNIREFIRSYIVAYNKMPTLKDFKKNNMERLYNKYIKNHTNLKKITKEVYATHQQYIKLDIKVQYSKEQLVTFLREFKNINKRNPSYSDCKRGLLPPLSTYTYNFGGFKNALNLIK